MAEFPAFYFHPVHARAGYLFNTQAELDSAGEGWVDTPAAFGVVTHPPEKIPGAPPLPVAVSSPPSTEADAKAVATSPSVQEVKLMNKPELYALAVDLPGIGEEVPADIESITKKELLTLVLSSLPKE